MIRCAFAVLTLLSLSAAAAVAEEAKFLVDHKTLYLSDPLGDVRRVELRGSILGKEGTGTILLDTNQCKLNEFGDRTESQLALVMPIAVTFKLIEGEAVDPSPKKDRRIYAIARAEAGEPAVPNIVLMVVDGAPWRLIHLDRAGLRRAITLEARGTYDGLAKQAGGE
jgi:hypothetical protein